MKRFLRVRKQGFLSLLLVAAIIVTSGILPEQTAQAASGYWYFFSDGSLVFGGAGYPHMYNVSMYSDLQRWDNPNAFPVTNLYKEGYTLMSWNTKSDGSGTSLPNTSDGLYQAMSDASVYLYAQWQPNIYEVQWNGNGGVASYRTAMLRYGTELGYYGLPSASRADEVIDGYRYSYTFEGWYTQPAGGSMVTASTKQGASDAVYYAHWSTSVSPEKYTLHFDGCGGTPTETQRIVARGSAYGTLPGAYRSPEDLDGYTKTYGFNGWYTQKTSGTKVTESTVMGAEDVTLYASWSSTVSPNRYTLTFDANGGTCTQTTKTVSYNSQNTNLPTPIRSSVERGGYMTNYQFDGWYTAAVGGDKVDASTAARLKDATLYAHWKETTSPITYSITFHANGGQGTMSPQQLTYGRNALLSQNQYSKTGYRFAGWSYSPDGAKAFDDLSAAQNLTQTNGENIALYALWEIQSFDVVCLDVVRKEDGSEDTVLGRQTWKAEYGAGVSGESLGTSHEIGAYYSGMRYAAADAGTVSEEGCTIHRFFEDFSDYGLNGITLGSEDDDGGYSINNGRQVQKLKVVKENRIKAIADGAFRESADTLQKVIFANATVERIGEYAFEGCSALEEIVLPYSVAHIGKGAFSGCDGLTEVILRRSDCVIGEDAFPAGVVLCGFANSTAVKYAKEHQLEYRIIDVIEEGFFEGEVMAEKVAIPEDIREVAVGAFTGCTGLKEIFFKGIETVVDTAAGIPEGTVIRCYSGSQAFEFADNLEYSVRLLVGFQEDGCQQLERKQYAGNTTIIEVIVGENLDAITTQAFTGCQKLECVTVEGCGLRRIGSGSFENCTALRNFVFAAAEEKPRQLLLSLVEDGAFANTILEEFLLYNPNCVIENTADEAYTFPKDTVLLGWSRSTAADYSEVCNSSFREIGKSYQVVFHPNGGEGGTRKIYTYTDMELPQIEVPTREGYLFQGYFLDHVVYYDASGQPRSIGEDIHITSDRIGRSSLMAQWKEEEKTPSTEDEPQTGDKENDAECGDTDEAQGDTSAEKSTGGEVSGSQGDSVEPSGDEASESEGGSQEAIEEADENKGDNRETSEDGVSGKGNKDIVIEDVAGADKKPLRTAAKKHPSVSSKKAIKKPQKGKVYQVGNLKYRVTAIVSKKGKQTGTVSVVGIGKKKVHKIAVPSSVKIHGVKLKVTVIAKKVFYKNRYVRRVIIGNHVRWIRRNAFYQCRNLQSVKIGAKKLKRIGRNVFDGCSNLKRITIKSARLKQVGRCAFRKIHSKAVVKVPARMAETYQRLLKKARG